MQEIDLELAKLLLVWTSRSSIPYRCFYSLRRRENMNVGSSLSLSSITNSYCHLSVFAMYHSESVIKGNEVEHSRSDRDNHLCTRFRRLGLELRKSFISQVSPGLRRYYRPFTFHSFIIKKNYLWQFFIWPIKPFWCLTKQSMKIF